MNTSNNNLLLKAISAKETKELTTIVKETIAVGITYERHFTAADLWNIQRRKRSVGQRNRFA